MHLFRFSLTVLLLATLTVSGAPVRVLFDTDFMTDCDDPGALGMLHALADRGECEILATFCSGLNAWNVPAIVAVNTYYGRGTLPVAAVKGSGVNMPSAYAQPLSQRFSVPATEALDALPAYRKLLAAQPDRSVVLLTVGYATNVKNLLNSKPDGISPLGGRELAAAKVIRWVNMGGNFERRPGIGPCDKPTWALESGRIEMRSDASFTWTPGAKGPRPEWRLLDATARPEAGLFPPAAVQELIEDLMIQPPAVLR